MSFGISIIDVLGLSQLAPKTLLVSEKACGEHDELTREVRSLRDVLRRLEREIAQVGFSSDQTGDLEDLVTEGQKDLIILDMILEKYNSLSEKERSFKKAMAEGTIWEWTISGCGSFEDEIDTLHISDFTVLEKEVDEISWQGRENDEGSRWRSQ